MANGGKMMGEDESFFFNMIQCDVFFLHKFETNDDTYLP